MKRVLFLIICVFVSVNPLYANEGNIFGGNPEVLNKQNQMQIRDFQIEKKYIETTPENIKKELKKKEDPSKDIVKEGITYNPQFHLTQIIFEGNKVISTQKLNEMSTDLLNKDVYLSDIRNLTMKISRYYQQKGYLTSYAYIPPQDIEEGRITISIKESLVVSKQVYGNKWEKDWFFKDGLLYAKGVRENHVFNVKDFQGAMKNLNKEAYMSGYAELSKDEDDNTIIKLNIADRIPFNCDLTWDDYGRNYTGRQRFTSILGMDNLFGIGDKIYGGSVFSSGSKGALAGYQLPVNKYGTKLSFDYSYSKVNLGGPYQKYDINGNATDYSLRLTHPLINTATKELTASISVNAVNSKSSSTVLGQALSDYKLRVLRTGLFGSFDDNTGRTITNVGMDFGTDGLGASGNINNGSQSSFYKFIAGVLRIQTLPKNCMAIIKLNGQYSPQSLYSSEQMYLGGVYSIRGYQPSELLGDYGIAGSFEVRTPVWGLKRILPDKIKNWADEIKLAVFYDWGYVKEHNNLYEYPNNFISSVGAGVYVNLTQSVYAQLGVGIPIGVKNYNEDKARFYFSINTELDRLFLKPKIKEKL